METSLIMLEFHFVFDGGRVGGGNPDDTQISFVLINPTTGSVPGRDSSSVSAGKRPRS